MDFNLDHLDIEKAEKTAKALQFFGLFGLGFLAFLLTRVRAYKASRPRARLKELETQVETMRTLIGELAKSVGANSTNLISVTDQLQAIVGDADRKIAMVRTDNESRYVRSNIFEDLCERVQQLDDRIWELGGKPPQLRRSVKREARGDDTGD